jgi:hypothetical protein
MSIAQPVEWLLKLPELVVRRLYPPIDTSESVISLRSSSLSFVLSLKYLLVASTVGMTSSLTVTGLPSRSTDLTLRAFAGSMPTCSQLSSVKYWFSRL